MINLATLLETVNPLPNTVKLSLIPGNYQLVFVSSACLE